MCPSGPIGVANCRGRLPCLPASDKNRYYYSGRHGSLPLLIFFATFNCVESRLHLNKAKQKVGDFQSFCKNSPLGPKGRFRKEMKKELSTFGAASSKRNSLHLCRTNGAASGMSSLLEQSRVATEEDDSQRDKSHGMK